MKTNLLSLTAILSFCICTTMQAQPAPTPAAQKARTVDPATRSNILAKTGGMIQSAAEGPSVLFLNTQNRVHAQALHNGPDQIQNILRLSCSFKDKPSEEPVAEALKVLADTNIAAVVVIGDCVGYPALLIAPENRWAFVNVAALGGNGVSDALLTERTVKELWRAFGYLMGAANSNFEHCLLKPVISSTDLDALKPKSLCPEPFNKIINHAQRLGMKPARRSSYRKAVEEGWAPAPTNDIQRAIWQELKK